MSGGDPMARIDTLRLLVFGVPPETLEGVKIAMREISSRIDEAEPGTALYEHAHDRLNSLLTRSEQLTAEAEQTASA